MQVKTIPVMGRDEAAVRRLAEAFKPARLNFAHVCLWCGARGCESASCVASHAASLWGPCESCDGFGTLASCQVCCNGVAETTVEGAYAALTRPLPAHVDAADYFVRDDALALVVVFPTLGRAA